MKPLTWLVTERATGCVCAMFTGAETRRDAYCVADDMGFDARAGGPHIVLADLETPGYVAPMHQSDREQQRRRFLHRRKA